jgi:hypothetical protein
MLFTLYYEPQYCHVICVIIDGVLIDEWIY